MSFSTKTDKLVKDLVQAEYGNACDDWGSTYNSLHEGYAVLLEEIEESGYEFSRIKTELSFLWENTKNGNEEMAKFNVDNLQKHTQNAMRELAQVGAVLLKIQNTINKGK